MTTDIEAGHWYTTEKYSDDICYVAAFGKEHRVIENAASTSEQDIQGSLVRVIEGG